MEFKFGLLVLLGVLGFVRCTPCSRVESVNISTGVQFENGSVVHDGVEYTTDLWYEAEEDGETVRFGCPCVGRTCLWKCCPAGSMLITRTCEPTDMEAVNPFRPPVHKGQEMTTIDATQHFFYMYNSLCIFRYLVDANEAGVELYVQEDATLYEIANGKHQWISPTMYCADMMLSNETLGPQFVALVCYPEATDDSSVLYIAYAVGLLLSVPFLLATFLVYAIIPELRNLHGMSLMAYCSGLIVAYPFLAYLKFNSGQVNMTIGACRAIAFVVYYAFQTSFFWLNVMCFDIWRTFSGYRGGGSTKQRERRRFMLYGLYAWGVPLLLTALLIFMQYYPDLPEAILRPGLGEMRCWFDDWKTEVLYFYSSVWTLVICNVVLFSVTAHRIRSIRQETAILKSSESSRSDRLKRDKQRYALYLKLFVVMGVNWTVEIISFIAGGSNWFWIVVDLSNLALGIVIFFIFVWKNKVRNLVRKKIAKWRGVPLDGPSTLSDSGAGRWATRSSSAPTEVTRVTSTDDAGVRLRDLR